MVALGTGVVSLPDPGAFVPVVRPAFLSGTAGHVLGCCLVEPAAGPALAFQLVVPRQGDCLVRASEIVLSPSLTPPFL